MKAGVANGFELQREMEEGFAAQKGADTLKGQESRKRGKRKALVRPQASARHLSSQDHESGKRREAWRGRARRVHEEVDCSTPAGRLNHTAELQGSLLPQRIPRKSPGNLTSRQPKGITFQSCTVDLHPLAAKPHACCMNRSPCKVPFYDVRFTFGSKG